MIDGLFTIAMQRKAQRMTRQTNKRSGQNRGGWRAFALGMVGMVVLIALWIVFVETTGEREIDEIQAISRPMAGQLSAPEEAERPISDYR